MPYTVLHADDDPALRHVYGGDIRMGGHKLISATCGKEALKTYHDLRERGVNPVVVTDWDMPDMNGMELIKSIRRTNPDAAIVMLSSKVGEHDHTDPDLRTVAMLNKVAAETPDILLQAIHEVGIGRATPLVRGPSKQAGAIAAGR